MENLDAEEDFPSHGGDVEMQQTRNDNTRGNIGSDPAAEPSASAPSAGAAAGPAAPTTAAHSAGPSLQRPENDIESNAPAIDPDTERADDPVVQRPLNDSIRNFPLKPTEAVRTEVLKALEARKRRLERSAAVNMPEIHIVGQIASGMNLISDPSEGTFCRWKFESGKAWQHLGGEESGQTHVGYCKMSEKERITFNHPIDLHYAEAGMQGWSAARMTIQCYRLDYHGRKILSGYGFVHIPTAPGEHELEVNLWRPIGTPDQELAAYLLGDTPALVTHDPIYETAWRERCRLVTVPAGSVSVQVFIMTRFTALHSVDPPAH